MSGVSVRGLTKSFGSEAVLRGVDLDVPEGSLTAILAPSGSGKTTLLRLIAGFEAPDAGTIEVGGRVVSGGGRDVAPAARKVGYVPQEGALFPHLDVAANVGFGLPRAGRAGRARRAARVAELLELVGLPGMTRRYPHQLSGGEQQRVALARALAPQPSVLTLDEPFSSLDASLRTSVRRDLVRILAAAGATAIVVTHDQDEALSMADQIAVLHGGVVGQAGPPSEVYTRPVAPALARFVGAANFLEGTVAGGAVRTDLGMLALVAGPAADTLADGSPVTVMVRPEQLTVGVDGGGMPGEVVGCEFHGHDAMVVVALVASASAEPVSVRLAGAVPPPPGVRVRVGVRGPVMAWPAAATTAAATSAGATDSVRQ